MTDSRKSSSGQFISSYKKYNKGIDEGFKYISSGRDTAIAINQNDEIFSMENVSFQDSGEIQYEWFQITGFLKSVSVHRGVAWGVNGNNQLYRQDVDVLRNALDGWVQMDNEFGISQIEIGELGVFGTNDDYLIFYRVGTRNNSGSPGTRWQQIPGWASHITSGLHNVYAVSGNPGGLNYAWQMKPNTFNDQTGEFEPSVSGSWTEIWERWGDRTGNNISAL